MDPGRKSDREKGGGGKGSKTEEGDNARGGQIRTLFKEWGGWGKKVARGPIKALSKRKKKKKGLQLVVLAPYPRGASPTSPPSFAAAPSKHSKKKKRPRQRKGLGTGGERRTGRKKTDRATPGAQA